jgi:hypothetical protein
MRMRSILRLERFVNDENPGKKQWMKRMTMTVKDYEQQLMRISRELNDIAKAIYQIGDDVVAGEVMQIEIVLRAFAIDPALRARAGGKRTSEEWHKYDRHMLYIGRGSQETAGVIPRDLIAPEEGNNAEELE